MTATRAETAQHRREGIADAAVLLVANRRWPRLELADWGELLGLEHHELVAAVDRFKATARPRRLAVVPAADGDRPSRYTTARPCPNGCGRTFVHFGRHLASCAGAAS